MSAILTAILGFPAMSAILGLPENILSFRSKKELLAGHRGKFLVTRKYIELENDKN